MRTCRNSKVASIYKIASGASCDYFRTSRTEVGHCDAWLRSQFSGVVVVITDQQIRFRCPAGHKLKAPPHYAGRHATCPACSVTIAIPRADAPPVSVTDSGVARMLGELNDQSSATHRLNPPAEREGSTLKLAAPTQRACDRCRKMIDKSASVCMHCQTMQFPSTSRIRSIIGEASRQILGRRTR